MAFRHRGSRLPQPKLFRRDISGYLVKATFGMFFCCPKACVKTCGVKKMGKNSRRRKKKERIVFVSNIYAAA